MLSTRFFFGMAYIQKRRELLLATYARSVSPLPDDPSVRKEQVYYTKFSAWCTSRRATDWDRNLVLNPSGQRLLAEVGDRAETEAAQGVVFLLPDLFGGFFFQFAAGARVDLHFLCRALVEPPPE